MGSHDYERCIISCERCIISYNHRPWSSYGVYSVSWLLPRMSRLWSWRWLWGCYKGHQDCGSGRGDLQDKGYGAGGGYCPGAGGDCYQGCQGYGAGGCRLLPGTPRLWIWWQLQTDQTLFICKMYLQNIEIY